MMKVIRICLLAVVSALSLTAATVPLPSFSQWEKPAADDKAIVVQANDTEGIVFTPPADGAQGHGAAHFVMEAPEPGMDLLLESAYTLEELNADAVPAIRVTAVDAAGKETILLDSGVNRPATGMATRRRDLLPADRMQEAAAARLRIAVYIYNFTAGRFALKQIRATTKQGLSGHAQTAFDGPREGIVFNEDCTQVFDMLHNPDEEQLCKYLDYYLVGNHQIREIMLNPNCQRASYGSRVFSPMWEDIQFAEDGTATAFGQTLPVETTQLIKSCKSLHDRNIDPYQVWIAHLRKRGVSPWISMRMNDCHDVLDEKAWIHGRFWRKHPEWRIGTYRLDARVGAYYAQGLDYAVPEVRDYIFAMVSELLERYDADGLELDFMRFGRVFAAGAEVEGRGVLTDFIAQIRQKADAQEAVRGHRIRLAVRVPALPEDAYRLGYDVAAWCDRHLVDIVTPTNFLFGNWPNTPLEQWRRIVGKDVLLAPCMECRFNANASAWSGGGAAIRAGMAADWLHRGADRIYLFNHMGRPVEENRLLMTGLGRLKTAAAMERRHYVGFPDFPALGRARTSHLPLEILAGDWGDLRIPVGPRPESGRKATLIIGFANPTPTAAQLEVRLNAKLLSPSHLPDGLDFPVPEGALRAYDATPFIQADDNTIELRNQTQGPITLLWGELHITAAPESP